MARLLGYFIRKEGLNQVNVLVATSGDTGSAVANGFLGVEGIHVYVLYPKGKVSPIQECQFTTLGQNITALEIDGTFDDCQALVKSAFMDEQLNAHLKLTSANSINVARFLPQSFYYFHAYAQMDRCGKADELVVCVPSGNFGNITAGLFARQMGLPIKHFIAANNRNDVFLEYLKTGIYTPRPSVQTLANAMDVGAPSNFARILDLYGESSDVHQEICRHISGARFTDEEIADTIRRTGIDFTMSGRFTKQAGGVEHLCNLFSLKCTLRQAQDLIEKLHPTPALAGLPKQKAIELIHKSEHHDREYYGGYIGPFAPNDFHYFVNLRSMKFDSYKCRIFVGGGIVSDSVPECEWLETEAKSKTLLALLPNDKQSHRPATNLTA